MATPYLIADSAQVTVLRSLASTAFGKYGLKLPEGVDLEDVYEVAAPGNELAYVSSLGSKRRVGGMFRRFVRADVSVTAQGEDMVPASDVERVLDEAAKRVSGDFFLESDISKAGLGPWVPMVDFHVGDIANVEIWGRVVPLAVTRIEPKRTEHSDNDWSVHVGGQLLSDSEARLAENTDIYNAVVSDRRDLAGVEAKASQAATAASRAQSTADSAQVAAGNAQRSADSALGRADSAYALALHNQESLQFEMNERVKLNDLLTSSLGELVSTADFSEYDARLQADLWGKQQEINTLSSEFQAQQQQFNEQQLVINRQQEELNAAQVELDDAQDKAQEDLNAMQERLAEAQQEQLDQILEMQRRMARGESGVWFFTPDDAPAQNGPLRIYKEATGGLALQRVGSARVNILVGAHGGNQTVCMRLPSAEGYDGARITGPEGWLKEWNSFSVSWQRVPGVQRYLMEKFENVSMERGSWLRVASVTVPKDISEGVVSLRCEWRDTGRKDTLRARITGAGGRVIKSTSRSSSGRWNGGGVDILHLHGEVQVTPGETLVFEVSNSSTNASYRRASLVWGRFDYIEEA